MAAIRIHNPNGSRKVANHLVAPIVAKNEKVGMGNAQNVYFREDTAKPSQVLVAAADPDTLLRIQNAKQMLVQRTMSGVWRALGIGLIGATVGFALVHFGIEVPQAVTLVTFVLTAIAVSMYLAIVTGKFWVAVLLTGAAMLTVITMGNSERELFQSLAFAVWFLVLGAPLYVPIIHSSLHANAFAASMTNLLYTIENTIKVDVNRDGIEGDPRKQATAQNGYVESGAPQPSDDIEININGEPVAHEPAIPHVVTRSVLIAPFNTERQGGLYTPAQALDFYILVSKEPRFMDRNNIHGHGLQVGSVPWRIDLTKNAHDDLKAGLYGLGAIVRVSGKYKVSGKTPREVATLIETACKQLTEEF